MRHGGRVGENIVLWTLVIMGSLNSLAIALSYAFVLKPPTANKIQARSYTLRDLNARMPTVLMNIGLLVILTVTSLSMFGDLFVWTAQPWWKTTLEVLLISLVDDAFFYVFHRSLHENKWLYRKIHKIHHKAFTPVPVEYIYVHPLEWMGGSLGIVLGVLVLMAFQGGEVSAVTFLIYSAIRNFHELDIHSGIRSKVLPTLFPFIGSAEHHDKHHSRPNSGNYGSTYMLWDKVMGTVSTEEKKG